MINVLRLSNCVCVLIALCYIPASSAQDTSDCNLIITTGLRNYNISSSSSTALDSIYSNYCDSSGNSNSSSTKAGLDVVVEEIPIGLSFGAKDASTAFRNFCKNYQSSFQSSQNSSSYESTIVTKAYDAFNECIALHANGINVKENILNLAQSSFFFTATTEHPLTIQGVTSSSNVSCGGQDSSGKLVQYTPSTNVKSTKNISFVCKRTPKAVATGDYYDEGTLSIATNVGNFDVFFPHDTKFSVDQASQFSQKLQEASTTLLAKVAAVNNRISGISLTESSQNTLPDFACGGQAIAGTAFTYMMGTRDGTSCGVRNVAFVKTLGLSIPAPQ